MPKRKCGVHQVGPRLEEEGKEERSRPVGVSTIHTVRSIAVHHQEEGRQSKPREQWGSDLQFVLACIGYVVGLGNIWRFPSLAYEHGGGAFLLPYLVCSFFFGLPLVLLEQSIGQFTQAGPCVGMAYYAPVLQGVGWAMSMVGATVGMYYNVVVAWAAIYLVKIVGGESGKWVSCRNEWNTAQCESSLEDEQCLLQSEGALGFYLNGSCWNDTLKDSLRGDHWLGAVSPAEEFFENYMTQKTSGMGELGGMNWKVLLSLFLVWCLVVVAMAKGVKWIGKIAYFSATVPYIIIAAFFIRGITLDGSYEGLEFYLLKPDFSYVFKLSTWKAALTHCCFSLSIGMGGIMAMSSYNDFNHNCYRDVLTVIIADNFMNVFGGTAVFTTLGFMAKQLGKPVHEVVQSGTSLIFVAYPEAMARMPLSSVWAFLFFFMLFVLGITTSFGYTQVLVTCLRDEFPSWFHRRALLTVAAASFQFLGGVVICTNAGLYWFNVFNDFTGSTCITLVAMIELVWMIHVYGINEFFTDLRLMFGAPRNGLERWLGSTGNLLRIEYLVVAPVLGMVVLVSTLFRGPLTYGKGLRIYSFPWWASLVGWALVSIPMCCIPLFAASKALQFRAKGKASLDLKEMLRIQPQLKSYGRIHGLEEGQRESEPTSVGFF